MLGNLYLSFFQTQSHLFNFILSLVSPNFFLLFNTLFSMLVCRHHFHRLVCLFAFPLPSIVILFLSLPFFLFLHSSSPVHLSAVKHLLSLTNEFRCKTKIVQRPQHKREVARRYGFLSSSLPLSLPLHSVMQMPVQWHLSPVPVESNLQQVENNDQRAVGSGELQTH